MKKNAFLDCAPPRDAGLFGYDLDLKRDSIVIIGVPWEATASYGRGTSRSPMLIPPASHQLDLYDEMVGDTFGECVGMLPVRSDWIDMNARCMDLADPIIERGGLVDAALLPNLDEVNRCSEQLNRELCNEVSTLLRMGKTVGVVGGDHSCPYGNMVGHFQVYPRMGVLHIDAHADLRVAYEGFLFSHASIMYNLVHEIPELTSLVSVGVRDYSAEEARIARNHPSITTYYDRDMKKRLFSGDTWDGIASDIIENLPQEVYVSLDVDGLEHKWCPNTGTPVPGGLGFSQTSYLLEKIVHSGRKLVGFDVCEVAPNPSNPKDEWDANVGARLIHKLCCLSHLSR